MAAITIPGGASLTPFAIDTAIRAAGAATGYSWVSSRPYIRIDRDLLDKSLYRKTPDYLAIRNLLMEGRTVRGAELTPHVVYVLSMPECAE